MGIVLNLLHLIGVALGAGGAFVGDALFLGSARDRILSNDEVRLMNIAGAVTWIGLFLLIASGTGMFLARPAELLASSKFVTKMLIVAIIALNGIVLHAYHTPHMKRHIGINFAQSPSFKKRSRLMLLSGSISVTSWIYAIVLGGLRGIPLTLTQSITLYFVIVSGAIIFTQLLRPFILGIRR